MDCSYFGMLDELIAAGKLPNYSRDTNRKQTQRPVDGNRAVSRDKDVSFHLFYYMLFFFICDLIFFKYIFCFGQGVPILIIGKILADPWGFFILL